jgi:hypothetical protein
LNDLRISEKMSDAQSDSANEQSEVSEPLVRRSMSSNDEDFSPKLKRRSVAVNNGEDFSPKLAKLRRCRSTSKAETIVTEEEKMRRAQPDKP